jgi:hypothetical protein
LTGVLPGPSWQAPGELTPDSGHVPTGLPIADPLVGLAITVVILRITWQSWGTVRGHHHHG